MASANPARAAVVFRAPLWVSGFRPFYLLGAVYGPALMALWLGAYLDAWNLPLPGYSVKLWHGHEMLFGFSAAIICGVVLTALPSWAGSEEVRGGKLALLTALWIAGRLAVWLSAILPSIVVMAVDSVLFVAVGLLLAPGLFRVKNKLYLGVLPVLAGFCAGNVIFHLGIAQGSNDVAEWGLRIGIHSIVVLYILKGGLLTPVFTGNVLRERGQGDVTFIPALEYAALIAVLLFAVTDLFATAAVWRGMAAVVAFAVHGVRLVRWQGWKIADVPLLWTMHLGYACLVVAFGLHALADFSLAVPPAAWIHVFTVGALGLMMTGLMTRVVLRHTGRRLVVAVWMVAAYAMMFAAAVIRVGVSVLDLGGGWIAAATVLWGAPFIVYLALYGGFLLQPSLPRQANA